MPAFNNKEELKKYVAQMLEIDHLDPKDQEEIINQLSDIIEERIVAAFIARLPEDEFKKADMLAESGNIDQLAQIMQKYVQDPAELANTIIEDTIKEFKQYVKEYESTPQQNTDAGVNSATSAAAGAALANDKTIEELEKELDSLLKQLEDEQSISINANDSEADINPNTSPEEQLELDEDWVPEELELDDYDALEQDAQELESSLQEEDNLGQSLDELQITEEELLKEFEKELDEDLSRLAKELTNQSTQAQNPAQAAAVAANQPPAHAGDETVDYEDLVVTDDGAIKPANKPLIDLE